MKFVNGSICAPQGFKASALSVPIRKPKKDLALIFSNSGACAAGVFTKNKAMAAPIYWCKKHLDESPLFKAILVNSGNANACTGEQGVKDCETLIQETAKLLSINPNEILIGSTGVIGQFLPLEKMKGKLPDLVSLLSENASDDVAEAIMTTDLVKKECAVEIEISGKRVLIGGVAKGSGMIAPNMATMLAFITTDIAISQPLLQKALSTANAKSFNRISVDGDESTNDMALVLANGMAKNEIIETETVDYIIFETALEAVMTDLAKKIVRDGEGATKFVEIIITGAESEAEAEVFARTVAESSLVKTALHGEDANWGRIMAALGYAGQQFKPEEVEISFGAIPILKKNFEIVLDESKAKAELSKTDLTLLINLNQGNQSATFWTCDLSAKYVEINGSYRS
ncbi:MAG: bifunctional glutamate N-acetyltransferase/amino-acid acetyltransferase ArgJ [Chloroherpetonaceae bacterium]|nr:bifunctional glutamate N-acetyltransferase/amino-acid acetyltransferase ArgJ [Chloroherpetonaceae bacterium]